ncbi:hypothetical protein ON010_g17939 [Phytophthora cinnamomi]|nr:hypothetical protein ON010_g17939 [Phytophthora cinnamomi]
MFMQAPDSEESKEYFALRRKAILAKLRSAGSKAMVAVNAGLLEHVENHDATNHVGEDTNEQLSCNHLYNATQTSAAKGNNQNASFVLDAAALT